MVPGEDLLDCKGMLGFPQLETVKNHHLTHEFLIAGFAPRRPWRHGCLWSLLMPPDPLLFFAARLHQELQRRCAHRETQERILQATAPDCEITDPTRLAMREGLRLRSA
eukprot:2574154-Pleurochrysis_carterae.AAC.3